MHRALWHLRLRRPSPPSSLAFNPLSPVVPPPHHSVLIPCGCPCCTHGMHEPGKVLVPSVLSSVCSLLLQLDPRPLCPGLPTALPPVSPEQARPSPVCPCSCKSGRLATLMRP